MSSGVIDRTEAATYRTGRRHHLLAASARAMLEEMTDAAAPFTCPRCAAAAVARFYGPCDACRSQLRATLGGEGREVAREQFVPAMHVTPNAVALKE